MAVTVTYADKAIYSDVIGMLPPRRNSLVAVTFGGAGQTYPANGIVLDKGGLHMQTFLEYVIVVDTSGAAGTTALWTFDVAHQTLRGYTAEATEIATGAALSSALTIIVHAVGF